MKQREEPHDNETVHRPHRMATASATRMSISQLLLEHVRRTASRISPPRLLGSVAFCARGRPTLSSALFSCHPRMYQQLEGIMEYATLGSTGLLVSRLCFGTMTFGDGRGLFKALSTVDQTGAEDMVKASIDGGINFIDTAENYTDGESENILGRSLKNLSIARKDVVVATKVYSRVGPGRNDIGASRGHIMDGMEASLRRLQTDHIDLYQIHANDSVPPLEETLRALDTLVQQGKIR